MLDKAGAAFWVFELPVCPELRLLRSCAASCTCGRHPEEAWFLQSPDSQVVVVQAVKSELLKPLSAGPFYQTGSAAGVEFWER